ncbi:hypothetical protein EVAR_21628_1 [Eumeta japonica]|uniref:Uncharacterized protein n=1 Tax=Eumeta variegata TaxID=151549 RepID=A0A4C1UY72_EUMVA|nr:hypothetical protein EVAR_21628_1 [Eumeta japonica]
MSHKTVQILIKTLYPLGLKSILNSYKLTALRSTCESPLAYDACPSAPRPRTEASGRHTPAASKEISLKAYDRVGDAYARHSTVNITVDDPNYFAICTCERRSRRCVRAQVGVRPPQCRFAGRLAAAAERAPAPGAPARPPFDRFKIQTKLTIVKLHKRKFKLELFYYVFSNSPKAQWVTSPRDRFAKSGVRGPSAAPGRRAGNPSAAKTWKTKQPRGHDTAARGRRRRATPGALRRPIAIKDRYFFLYVNP